MSSDKAKYELGNRRLHQVASYHVSGHCYSVTAVIPGREFSGASSTAGSNSDNRYNSTAKRRRFRWWEEGNIVALRGGLWGLLQAPKGSFFPLSWRNFHRPFTCWGPFSHSHVFVFSKQVPTTRKYLQAFFFCCYFVKIELWTFHLGLGPVWMQKLNL